MSEINILFPDGSEKKFPKNSTGLEIANSISKSLAKNSLAVKLDGELQDLSQEISQNAKIEIVTRSDSEEALKIIRHDAAHLDRKSVV